MSVAEKLGELMMVDLPMDLDTTEMKVWISEIEKNHIGGILVKTGNRDEIKARIHQLRKSVSHPIWIGLQADAAWADQYAFPHFFQVGMANTDTLARDWGRALGEECRALDAQLCFVPAALLCGDSAVYENSFGENPRRVSQLAQSLVQGISETGIQSVIRSMPDMTEMPPDSGEAFARIPGSTDDLQMHWLRPLREVLQKKKPAVQLSHILLSDLDSLPLSMSERIIIHLLRNGLDHNGLIFSPSFSDSLFAGEYQNAEIQALSAGTDIIVTPLNAKSSINTIAKAVEEGHFAMADLDEKVHKVLFQKALWGLDTLLLPDSIGKPKPMVALKGLNRNITETALTLLRDVTGRIPFGSGVTQSKVATLSIGLGRKSDMQRSAGVYAKMDHFILGAKSSQTAYDAQLRRLGRYSYVLVGLHAPLLADSGRFPVRTLEFLDALQEKTRLVTAQFGGIQAIPDLDSLQCVIYAHDDRKVSQQVAAQYVFGGVNAHGRLPVCVGNLFCEGDGLDHGQKTRLEYTIPEELGFPSENLERIDSIIKSAIFAGTFPGCQVLAAKDGKVFLHKAYGHHDYDRTRRVRLNDVYDIASITKIAATTLMAMRAWEDDTLHLDYPLKYYLEELDSSFITIKDITPKELMIHQAGLPPGLPVYKYYTMIDSVDSLRSQYYSSMPDSLHDIPVAEDLYFSSMWMDSIWNRIRTTKLDPIRRYKYSDMSMFLMKMVLERIEDVTLDQFMDSLFYGPLGLQTMCYHPLDHMDIDRIVPTENDRWWRKQVVHGYVHDHSTALYGGVGGQAGLFSNVQDLATIMQMLLNGGKYGGKRYFKRHTVARFTTRQPNSHRGLGFDMQKPAPVEGKGYCCTAATPATFGHFGFTGTCAWADPEHDIVYILLTNRVYPKANNWKINTYRVRQAVQQEIYDALGLGHKKTVMYAGQDSTGVDSSAIVATDSSLIGGN